MLPTVYEVTMLHETHTQHTKAQQTGRAAMHVHHPEERSENMAGLKGI